MSILASDKALAEKLELTDLHEMSADDKKGYVTAQLDAIKQQLWRSRVDAVLNHNLKTENKSEEIKVAEKIEEHEQNAKRYAEAITLLQAIADEL
jgi:DNA polymerase IIIc chi subunit